jgi:signal transduction histidine kinase
VQLFLIGVTAGGAGGLNRALLFLAEDDELVGHTGLGHLSREEGQKTWIAMAESGSELQQLIDRVFDGTFHADAELNTMLRTIRLRRDGGSPPATAMRERLARYYSPGGGTTGHPRLDELYKDTPFVAVPLYMEHDEVGVLVADNFVTGLPIIEETISLLQTLAHQAASEIITHRLHDDLQRQLQETEHLYELLRENQNYLLQHERLVDMGKLATTVAHEIKTPLVAIGGFARRAERRLAAGEKPSERDLDMIIKEVSRLERITSEILDYSKEVKLNFEKVDLREALDESLDIVESRLDAAGIQVQRHYANTACLVKADPRRLKQVVLNLLENAIDALSASPLRPTGGGVITLAVSPAQGSVTLEVSDTGPGIPDDLFDRVFTPFFTTKPEGSGLGLPVTRRIITDHGGRISLSKTELGHTRFLIELPGWHEPVLEEMPHVANIGR